MVQVSHIKLDLLSSGKELGVLDNSRPRVSWECAGDEENWRQSSYQIRVQWFDGSVEEFEAVQSEQSTFVNWPARDLKSREQLAVSVKVGGSEWSEFYAFETGELGTWEPPFIAMKDQPVAEQDPPETLFRKEFAIGKSVKSARVYSTAMGAYQVELNGRIISTDYLAPGWTSYTNRVLHQVYDVAEFLKAGENAIGARVAAGWYSGHLGFEGGQQNIYGTKRAISLMLEVIYDDGTTEKVLSDASWSSSSGPIVSAELYNGEDYDARLEQDGWSTVGFSNSWKPVEAVEPPKGKIIPQSFPYIRCITTLKAKEIITTPSGKKVFDFGENLVGFIRIKKSKAPEGHKVTLRHAEVMEKGELGVRPLRLARSTDTYTFRGLAEGEEWSPRFTSHGFRYCEVNNWYGDLSIDSIEFIVFSSDMSPIGSFESSNEMVNKLHQNTVRSVRGNFVSLPTDCPQRDERLGWTGDIAQFSPTATFLFDCAPLLRNWLHDFKAEQLERGGLPPMIVPNIACGLFEICDGCAIWHDAAMLVPEALFHEYGDKNLLAEQYESMEAWINTLPMLEDKVLWRDARIQLGDWLDPTAPPDNPLKAMTDARLVADAYLYKILNVLVETATVLGKDADAKKYRDMATRCKKDFSDEYISATGRIVSDTQCAYTLALVFDLFAENQRQHAGKRLSDIVRRGNFKVGSGFAGTPHITTALTETGNVDFAYKMLLQTECPSWLYAVSMGATTIWERYDSMLPDGSINPGDMTSFNHYALGSVCNWIYRTIGGLSKSEPGWKTFKVEPILGGGFTHCKTTHKSPYGLIEVSWKLDGLQFSLDVTVPLNSSAEVVLPTGEKKTVGSGKWHFSAQVSEHVDATIQADKDDITFRI